MNEKEYFCVPRNVRQMGEISESCRVYIEDYAYTFLCQPLKQEEKGRICLLLGASHWKEETQYVFVKSALWVQGAKAEGENIIFGEETWGQLSEQRKKSFPKQDVVGWVLEVTGQPLLATEAMRRVQRNYFGEKGNVLFLFDSDEKEEALFLYEQNKLVRQKGYYIYYERNEPMQEYLVEQNHNESIEVQGVVRDKAVKDFRKIIEEKNQEKDTRHTNRFLYAASACLVFGAVGAGLSFLNRLPGLDQLQSTVQTTAEHVLGVTDKETSVPVETNTDVEVPKSTELPKTTETFQATEAPQVTETPKETETPKATDTPKAADTPNITDTPKEASNQAAETPSAETGADISADYATYTVREGDTLNVISYRYYGTIFEVQDICSLNNMSPEDLIYPGQKILLP